MQTPENPGLLTNLWHAVGLYFWVIIFHYLNEVRVIGEENRPQPGESNILIASNHISAIDPFAIAATSMPFFSGVWWRAPAKAELFSMPVVKRILATWGAIPVRRGQRDMEAIQRMVDLLPHSVMVAFPEGRRSTDGQLQPGRAGLGKIIYDARPKVIPVYLEGTDIILPKGKTLPLLYKTITLCYGKPLDLVKFYERPASPELSQQIADEVMRAIAQLREEVISRKI